MLVDWRELWTESTLCASSNTILDTHNAVLELLLRNPQVLVRVGQVRDFIVKLLLDLRKLLHTERIQIDYKRKVSARDTGSYFTATTANVVCALALLWFPLPASAIVC
jgi:hypothetical protein